ncbi:hypothetical protein E1283_07495 [Streptomyces hainanensis]|uniref:Uncharacterized protein n=2 Tax=Streptomyces hainanensis TaxID=402648 RepID=A0A4R4TNB2_9ACTN|nr:hypothetical protein E1283_07495 [Streptomyces hainanensis]
MLLWLGTAAGLLVLLGQILREIVRSRRDRGVPGLTFAMCIYLHDRSVMDHFQMGRYTEALQKEVEQRDQRGAEMGVDAGVLGTGGTVGVQGSREVVSRWLEVAEPISVIGVIVAALEREHVVVHADLLRRTVRRNEALVKTMGVAHGVGRLPEAVPLGDVDDFVLVRGRFRRSEQTPDSPGTTVFTAPYGTDEDPTLTAHVRVTCRTTGLRTEVPSGAFSGRCLGKVGYWNPADGVLEVDALAIFR